MQIITAVLFLGSVFISVQADPFDPEKILFFVYNNPTNQVFNWTIGTTTNNLTSASCPTTRNMSFIIPGWMENCETKWVPDLIAYLAKYRGGCIVCMDYSYYSGSTLTYPILYTQFKDIAKVLEKEYFAFEEVGHEAKNCFFFGFSFGAQLSLEVGKQISQNHSGTNLISRMDLCEPATGFAQLDSRSAAVNVQCIHTDKGGLGTSIMNCHQDWNMGNCGQSQDAAAAPPMGDHGLCPHFYNSAFEHDFYAKKRDFTCMAQNEAKTWPVGFKMGYMETRFTNNTGEFFAATTKYSPYT